MNKSFLLASIMVVTLVACGKQETPPPAPAPAPAAAPTPAPAPAPAPAAEPAKPAEAAPAAPAAGSPPAMTVQDAAKAASDMQTEKSKEEAKK
jgi:hypothetical protein